jgi:hypothetical protein
MNPPDNAIVLCVDEKSRIQALERAIKDFIKDRNVQGRSFKRTKKPEEILAKIQKARKGTVMHNV